MRRLVLLLLMLFPLQLAADSTLPFMKELAGDRTLPRTWGIGLDFYTMDQDYDITSLQFALPGVSLDDPSLVDVTNEIEHYDLQADVWLFPFLNVFGLIGQVKSDTFVDLSAVEIAGLPFDLPVLPVTLDGTVYGGGFTLAYGTEKWFTTVTSTWTKTSVKKGLDSSIKSLAVQPRLGLLKSQWRFWLGAMYLDVDEEHSGTIELPFLGEVPFAVDLATTDHWNYAAGVGYEFSDRANLTFELGFGKREHTLFNFNVRF